MSNFLAWQMHNVAPDGLAWQACHRSGLPLVDLLTWHPLQRHSVAGWDIGVVRAPLSLSPLALLPPQVAPPFPTFSAPTLSKPRFPLLKSKEDERETSPTRYVP